MPTHRIEAPRRGRVDALLAEAVPDLSRSRIAALVRDGGLRVDGMVVARPAAKVPPGAKLVLEEPEPVPMEARPQDLPLRIVYEDDDLVVVDKEAGMVVHPAPGHADGTLVNALLHHVEGLSGIGGVQRPGIVHRLDRGTSGLMVVAKHDRAHQHLAAQFAAHSASRRYLALCYHAPQAVEGTIESQLARHPTDRVRWASTEGSRGRRAVTHWQRLAVSGWVSLIGCQLETGRTHQVRVHLTEAGWPLIGDPVYKRRGCRVPAAMAEQVRGLHNRPLLHAWSLELNHPSTGSRVGWVAPLPADYLECVRAVDLAHALPQAIRPEGTDGP